jgi:4-amino-4-deoxy-L-arabinose transferase-like glycosyltransferase
MKRFISRFPWLIPAFILTVLLMLGARAHPLWGDEAETGIYGRNILTYGIPKGWDGVNLMGFNDGVTINSDLVENSNPWPQYYLVALSFKLFGISSFTARIPFILFGVGSLIVLWYLVDDLVGNRSLATLTVVKSGFNIALILYLYQARYFSLVTFFGLLFIWGAFRIRDGGAKWFATCVVSGILGIYSQPMAFILLVPSLLFSLIWSVWRSPARKKNFWRISGRLCAAGIIVAAAYAPWVYWMKPLEGRGFFMVPPLQELPLALWNVASFLYQRINETNTLPVLLLPFVIWYFLHRDTNSKRRMLVAVLGIAVVVYFLIGVLLDVFTASDSPVTTIRYHVIVLPMLMVVAVGVIQWLREQKRWLGGIIYVVYLVSSFFTISIPRSLLVDYLGEVLHPYEAPDEAVAKYLAEHAKDGDTAYLSLDRDHEPLVFFLNKKIRFINRIPIGSNKFFPKNFKVLPPYIYQYIGAPKWVILYSTNTKTDTFETLDNIPPPIGVDLTKLSDMYDETILPVYFSDMTRPEINLHSFTAIPPAPNDRIFIYHRKM